MTAKKTTKQAVRKRGHRRSLWTQCLGIGALAVAFLARLIAHCPRCPGPLAKQQALSRPKEGEWQERPVQISVDVKLRL